MRPEVVLHWTARVWGIASALLLLAFAFGGREHFRFTAAEAVVLLLFSVGAIVGYMVAWRRALVGGLVTISSLILFFLWLFARGGSSRGTPYFLLFAGPGFLHVASALIAARRAKGAAMTAGVNPGGPGNQDAEPVAASDTGCR